THPRRSSSAFSRIFWSKAPTGAPTISSAATRWRRAADGSSGCRCWKAIQRQSFFAVFAKVCEDDVSQLLDARRRVDAHPQMRAAVNALRIPGTQRAQFIDHPALTPPGLTRSDFRDMAESL